MFIEIRKQFFHLIVLLNLRVHKETNSNDNLSGFTRPK
jgi:hypothetical protein